MDELWRRFIRWWRRRREDEYVSAAWLRSYRAHQLVPFEGVSSKFPWPSQKKSDVKTP